MARRSDLPIIIGKNMKKGIVAGPSRHFGKGADLYIVWLKNRQMSGSTFDADDVQGVNAVLHFCDRESVKRTIDILTEVLLKWKD